MDRRKAIIQSLPQGKSWSFEGFSTTKCSFIQEDILCFECIYSAPYNTLDPSVHGYSMFWKRWVYMPETLFNFSFHKTPPSPLHLMKLLHTTKMILHFVQKAHLTLLLSILYISSSELLIKQIGDICLSSDHSIIWLWSIQVSYIIQYYFQSPKI